MKYDFITIGGAVEDVSLHVSDEKIIKNPKDVLQQKLIAFEYGAKVRAENCSRHLGGGANNAAVCLSKMGMSVGILTSVGNDEIGKKIFKNLDQHKIDTRLVERTRNIPSGFSVLIIGPAGEHTAFVYRGAAEMLEVNNIAAHMLPSSKNIYVSSLSGLWEKVLTKIFSVKDSTIFWNPGYSQIKAGVGKLKKYLSKTEILFLNKDESLELVLSSSKYKKMGEKFLHDKKGLAEALKSFGSKKVVITDGENGADYFDGEIFYHEKSLRIPAKNIADTTGIGDAFCATFVGGLEKYKGNYKKSLKLAMRNAASVLKKPGAQNGLLKL